MSFATLLVFSLFLFYCCEVVVCRQYAKPVTDFGSPYLNQQQQPQQPYLKPNQYPSGISLSYGPEPIASGNSTSFNETRGSYFPPIPSNSRALRPDAVTDAELMKISELLYSKENSLIDQIMVNLQGRTRSVDTNDVAPQPLLYVSDRVLSSPTITKMRALFDNYEMDTSVNEVVTPYELQEEDDFINAVLSTNVMAQAMFFLQNKGIVSYNIKSQKDLLKTIWFTIYSRGQRVLSSSGFEHVFVNEINKGKLIGLHNWVYFNEQEKAGHLDYKGYLSKLDLGNKGQIIGARFTFDGLVKPVNTMFVGTSPELEMALYTICFELRADQICPVSLGGRQFIIQTNTWRHNGLNLIGSAFPRV